MQMNAEALARELHDVAFAWNHSMQPWDGLTEEHRQWFLDRAAGILAWDKVRGLLREYPEQGDGEQRRTMRSEAPPKLDPEAVREAVRAAKERREADRCQAHNLRLLRGDTR
jgi:hypothetical protein